MRSAPRGRRGRTSDLRWEIDDPVNKDTKMRPLVRWQFRGGVPKHQRRAFLFTNVDGSGHQYDNGVLIGAVAASSEVYATGLRCGLADVGAR